MDRQQTNIDRIGEWIEMYQEPLYRYAFFRLGNRIDAEDVLQDAFLKVASSKREILSPKAYLYAAVTSGCVDILRRRKPTQTLDERIATPPSSEQAEAEEEFCRINALLKQLPDAQCEVIRLHIHSNLKFTEIAEILDTPVSTIKSRFSSGIERLKQLFIN